QLFWPRLVVRKWLNIAAKESDYSADTESDCSSSTDGGGSDYALPFMHRRRKSETFRAQYISAKELRVRVATWNVGGKMPPDDLDIDGWVNTDEPADIYVLGLQEIVPLNAGNIFGAEDSRPATKWENIIRDTLNSIRPVRTKVKCYSEPVSPSRFNPSDEVPGAVEEILLESDSDIGEEVHPLDEDTIDFAVTKDRPDVHPLNALLDSNLRNFTIPEELDFQRQASQKSLNRLNCIRNDDASENVEESGVPQTKRLTRKLSGSERIGLSWPEPQLNLLSGHVLQRPGSFKSIDLESLLKRKRSAYVRIVSKQMVGVFITVWVRRHLRKHIQNVKVSTVGVGVMGYIGNKGSVSVSMSVYQTPLCFICTHLTSGEKEGDEIKRNADVHEIHKRTNFRSVAAVGLPKSISDHERIVWLGDLNYRINLSYEKTRELIADKQFSALAEYDQLTREFRKGRVFDGWREGTLTFPPTYKYEFNSSRYCGEDPKAGRRTPAWCDRILSYGKGFRLLSYRRTELKLSDHRPVTATYMVEVEVFCPRRLQRALTYTDAEIGSEEVEIGLDVGMSLQLQQVKQALIYHLHPITSVQNHLSITRVIGT
ncbi:Type IV inositol polyphosphate 5-phosphatase 3, partial [Linum perenne]